MNKDYIVEGYYAISGNNFIEAIENNFNKMGLHFNIGNIAGYKLKSVKAEYDPYLFCNAFFGTEPMALHTIYVNESLKQIALNKLKGIKLTVEACGSDALVNFDPNNNPIKTTIIKINANEDDLPDKAYVFDIK